MRIPLRIDLHPIAAPREHSQVIITAGGGSVYPAGGGGGGGGSIYPAGGGGGGGGGSSSFTNGNGSWTCPREHPARAGCAAPH